MKIFLCSVSFKYRPLICRAGGPGGSTVFVIPGWEPPGSSHVLCRLQRLHPWMEGMVGAVRSSDGSVLPGTAAGGAVGPSACHGKQVLEQAVLLPAKPHCVHRRARGCCGPTASSGEEKVTAVSTEMEICWQGWLGVALCEQKKRCFN